MAMVSVKNTDDALDIVQDAMFILAKKYSNKPREEWPPLFYRVLNNRVTDFHRATTRRARLFNWFSVKGAVCTCAVATSPATGIYAARMGRIGCEKHSEEYELF